MDNYIVYGSSFDACLKNLTFIFKRCMETNLNLNYKKYHFMVEQKIILWHLVYARCLEIDNIYIYICIYIYIYIYIYSCICLFQRV